MNGLSLRLVVLVLSSILVRWLFNKYQFSSIESSRISSSVVIVKFTLPLVPIKLSQTLVAERGSWR